jgi:glycosyltransferase involved in cell wall biosynthesis
MAAVIPPASSRVAILLCTYQGREFLPLQLDSIAAQTHQRWSVYASDDGSSDGTVEVLERCQRAWELGRMSIVAGPRRGFVDNFLSLTCHPEIDADYFAYADQDDIWEPEKLARALDRLTRAGTSTPALYGSRTRLIDRDGHVVGQSPLFGRPPSFANALAHNIAGGNTMVFNRAARALLRRSIEAGCAPVTYDWWTYLLVSGAGGIVMYDPEPMVRYRQHAGNQVGARIGVSDRAGNVREMLRGRVRGWSDVNLAALERVRDVLTPENLRTLDMFRDARRRSLVPRLVGLWRSGVRRQTAGGNAGLWLAAVLGRV